MTTDLLSVTITFTDGASARYECLSVMVVAGEGVCLTDVRRPDRPDRPDETWEMLEFDTIARLSLAPLGKPPA